MIRGLVYNNAHGEKDASIIPDARGNLARALGWTRVQRGAGGCASAANFFERAAQAGLSLNPAAFGAFLRARKELAAGSEHTVYFDKRSQRVIKVTHPDIIGDGTVGQHPDVGSYLRNLDLLNRAFGDDVRLEGIVQQDGEVPQIVISQPFVKGARQASSAEVDAYLKQCGFQARPDGSYFNPQLQVRVSDAVGPNILARDTPEGVQLFPIDPQLHFEGDEYPFV
jgi:hypothetical protein